MGSRVVRPETKRLTISNGDWLLVKKRLNHGEQQDAFARTYIADGSRVNLRLLGMTTALAFLVDWSLTGPDDQVIDIRGKSADDVAAALNSFDAESVAEIRAAIDQHVLAMAEEREAAKNETDGATGSAVISPSPFAAAGASNGSAN